NVSSNDNIYLHSFPTRRSSDLVFTTTDFIQPKFVKKEHKSKKICQNFRLHSNNDPFIFRKSLFESGYNQLKLNIFYLRFRMKKRSEEHTSELQSRFDIVCRLLL